MLQRLLIAVSTPGRWRPLGIAIVTFATVIVAAYTLTLPVDFSFSGLMDREHPEVARYFDASRRFGLGGRLPLLIEGPEAILDEAEVAVRAALEDLSEVRFVSLPPPRDWLMARSPWLVDWAVFERWVEWGGVPADPEHRAVVTAALEELRALRAPPSPSGARLLMVFLARDTFELALDADDFPRVRRVAEKTLSRFGVSGRFAGMPAIITQEQEATLERMGVLAPASLCIVLLILFLIERRWLLLATIAAPMLGSVAWTLGVVGVVAGDLTLMESLFGVLVFGLGIDFAIHLLVRVREEQAAGGPFEQAMRRAMLGTGRGIVVAGLTTAGAFLILAVSPDPVFYRLGLAGGLGLLLCMVFLLWSVPITWAWVEARYPARESERWKRRRPGWLERCAAGCERHPWPVLAAGLTVMVISGVEARSVDYETNLERVFSRDIDAVETARQIHQRYGVDAAPWVVAARDPGHARELARAFGSDPMFGRVETLAWLFPPDVEARRQALDAAALGFAAPRSQGAGATPPIAAGREGTRPVSPADRLLEARRLGPPKRDQLPGALTRGAVGPEGEILVAAFPAVPALDADVAARERRAAQSIDPSATSMNAIYEALIGTDRPWMPPVILAVAAFILVVIRIEVGSLLLTLVTLVPVLGALSVTVATFAAIGLSFNTVTLVGVPLLFGLAVDDGIHVVHGLLEAPDAPAHRAVGRVARGIALTTATTCGSVGLLLFTRHPGLETLASLLLIGLPVALAATVTLLPALSSVGVVARVLRRGGTSRASLTRG
jgi:hypothetical protein